MNENEIFVDIEGYEGLYQVSNLGNVKSYKFGKEKILKQRKIKNGYLFVSLWKNEKMKQYYVHRLVANAFVPNPNKFRCVNHKDEDKTNNIVDNLEWCTQQYNVNYGTCIQRRVAHTDYKAIIAKINYKARTANTDYKTKVANTDYKAIAEKTSKQVYQYSKDLKLIKI